MKTRTVINRLVLMASFGLILGSAQGAFATSPPVPGLIRDGGTEYVHRQGKELAIQDAQVIERYYQYQNGSRLATELYVDLKVSVVYGNPCLVADPLTVLDFRTEYQREMKVYLMEHQSIRERAGKICPMYYSPTRVTYILDRVQVLRDGKPLNLSVNGIPVRW